MSKIKFVWLWLLTLQRTNKVQELKHSADVVEKMEINCNYFKMVCLLVSNVLTVKSLLKAALN